MLQLVIKVNGFFFNWVEENNLGVLGEDINIILTESSPSYDHVLFGFDILDYRFRYFHGFLESIGHSSPINRYIVGRAIEKTNFKNLIFSFSEIIIYQGETGH